MKDYLGFEPKTERQKQLHKYFNGLLEDYLKKDKEIIDELNTIIDDSNKKLKGLMEELKC